MKMQLLTTAILCLLICNPLANAGTLTGKVQSIGPEPVVIWVEGIHGNFSPSSKKPSINHKNKNFDPAILIIMKGTTVDFPNSDDIFHSAYSESKSNPFDLGIYGPGNDQHMTFNNPGLVKVFCHIHDHMYTFIHVVNNPFFTTVNESNEYTIPDIPKGTYRVKTWKTPRSYDTKTITINGDEMVSLNFRLRRR